MRREVDRNKANYSLVIKLGCLMLFGIIILASASSPVGYERYGDSYFFVKNQIFRGIIPGIIACYIVSKIPYYKWKSYSTFFFGITIGLLITVFIPQLEAGYGTTQSWISIGFISMQPAEVAKLTFILALSGWLSSRSLEIRQNFHRGFVFFLALIAPVIGLLILQPDIGTMMIFALIAVSIYFAAGIKIQHLLYLLFFGIIGLVGIIATAPYRLARLFVYLNPASDIRGAGYQLNQALIAAGSGGLFGLGLGHSRQKYLYLPEVTSDSIFAIIGEELGFFVSAAFVILLLILFLRIIKIGVNTKDDFAFFVCVGIASWIFLQSIVNIGAIIGILPLTGVPLPFVSHGGSAMVALLAGMGIIINISKNRVLSNKHE